MARKFRAVFLSSHPSDWANVSDTMTRPLQILAALFIIAVLVSQSAMDLFSSLILLTMAFWLAIRRDGEPLRTGWNWLFLAWFVVLALGYAVNLAANPPWFHGLGTFRWFLEFLALVALWRTLRPGRASWKFACGVFILCGAYSVAVYALGFNPLFEGPEKREANLAYLWRSGGFYGEAMAWAHTMGPIFALCAGAGYKLWTRRDPLWWWFAIAAGFTGLAVLFTMTRGVWAAAALTIPVMAYLVDRRRGFVALALVIVGSATILTISPSIRDRVLFTLNFQQTHDSERLVLWRTNYHIFKDSPLVGWGYGENQRRLREAYDSLGVPENQFTGHAHNQIMHMLAGTGALGLACYLVFWWLIWRTTRLWWKASGENADPLPEALAFGILGAILLFHLGSMTEANFAIAKNRMAILTIASVAVAFGPRPFRSAPAPR